METARRDCPICGQGMSEREGCFTCSEHGAWLSYSPNLLVRAPSAEAKTGERIAMPWE